MYPPLYLEAAWEPAESPTRGTPGRQRVAESTGPCTRLEFCNAPTHRATCKRASHPACFVQSAKTIPFQALVSSAAD